MIALSLVLAAVVPPGEVVVYPDRARVSRTQTLSCAAPVPVVFDGLPPATDERSIAAVGDDAQIEGVTIRRMEPSSEEETRSGALGKELAALDWSRMDLNAALRRAQTALELERGFQEVTKARMMEQIWRPRPDLRGWRTALDTTLASRVSTGVELRAAETHLRENDEKREEAQARGAVPGARMARGTLSVEILARCTGSVPRISLVSTVGGTGWAPRYEARWDEASATLRWTALARIEQRTGEDWHNVRLRLSTALPEEGSDLPRPRELRVEALEQPEQKKTLVRTQSPIAHAPSPSEVYGLASNPAVERVSVEDQGLSSQLSAPDRADVPGDGSAVQVRLSSGRLPANELLVARPNLRPQAFRVLRVLNASPIPLLPGTVAIHTGAGYVGHASLSFVPSGGPFDLTLGIDPRIRIARTVRQEAQRAGRRIDYGYSFQATNPGREPLLLEISDRIPVSELEEVEVRVDDGTTPGYQLARDDGILTWKTELPAGGSRTVELRYHLDVGGEVDLSRL
jgi:uncharacterized protein (TIGR02231 family)